MSAIRIRSDLTVAEVFQRFPEALEFHWMTCYQGGTPIRWDPEMDPDQEQLDALLQKWVIPHLRTECSDLVLWRPGILPTLSERMKLGEWTWFVGFAGTADQVYRAVEAWTGSDDQINPAITLVYPDGWWEIQGREDLVGMLAERFPVEVIPRLGAPWG